MTEAPQSGPDAADPRFALRWAPRSDPLRPVAVVATGDAATRLADRLTKESDERLGRLRGIAGADVLLLIGDAGDLPWVDGVGYLGRDPAAPNLLLPTNRRPSCGGALLTRRLGRDRMLAVLVDEHRLVNIAAARAVHRETLEAWRAGR